MTYEGSYLEITVRDIDQAITDFDRIQVYSASSRTGSYSSLTTISLVADQSIYSYQATTAAATTWYKWRLNHSGTALTSDWSEPFPAVNAPVVTRLELRRRIAHALGLFGLAPRDFTFPGPSGTTTASGSASTVVCSQYSSTALPTDAYSYWYVLLTSGPYSGEERQLTRPALSGGTFTLAGDTFTGAPGNAVTFDLYGLLPTGVWNDKLNAALLDTWTPFEWPMGGVAQQTEYSLPYFIERGAQILGLTRRTGSDLREKQLVPGHDFILRPTEGGGATLYIERGLATTDSYLLEGWRHPPPLSADTDTLTLAEEMQRYVVISGAAQVARHLAEGRGGLVEDSGFWGQRAALWERRRKAMALSLGLGAVVRSPRTTPMVWI